MVEKVEKNDFEKPKMLQIKLPISLLKKKFDFL